MSDLPNKTNFFSLLEKLLDDGLVMFIASGADCYTSSDNPNPKLTIEDPNAHWKASVAEIMRFVRDGWPSGANDMNDLELTYYFYALPGKRNSRWGVPPKLRIGDAQRIAPHGP